VAPEEIAVRRRLLNLRFAGQETALAVEHDGDDAIESAFAAAYREIYGYAPEGRTIELESVRVIASSRSVEAVGAPDSTAEPFEAEPAGRRRCFTGSAWREVPFFDRALLRPGAGFEGPALVFERHSATLLAGGWRGRVDAARNLVLESGG
jgi:5-oxoprolinase (ATP-hydrolysing)